MRRQRRTNYSVYSSLKSYPGSLSMKQRDISLIEDHPYFADKDITDVRETNDFGIFDEKVFVKNPKKDVDDIYFVQTDQGHIKKILKVKNPRRKYSVLPGNVPYKNIEQVI